MTLRALLIGLALGLGIAVFGFFNDFIMQQPYVASDLIPISVYGLLILALLVGNPLLRLIRRAQFSGAECAVVAAVMLVACAIPGPGLMWQFGHAVVLPHMYNKIETGWKDKDLMGYVPDVMLVDPGDDYERVVPGFKEGLRRDQYLPFHKIPWGAWIKTLSFWLPLIGLSFIAGTCIVLVVHRQWAHRERLRYPVADFASELVRGAESGVLPSIFHNRKFWLGFIPVVVILLINGYQAYEPDSIKIPLSVNLASFEEKWPVLTQVPNKNDLLKPTLYFAAIGFAYFVSTEVSFSIGISHILYTAVFLALLKAGVQTKGDYLGGGMWNFNLFGAYLGAGLMALYLGRRFYGAVVLKALCIPVRERVERGEVWACRMAVLAGVGMTMLLWRLTGLSPFLSGLFVMLTGLLFLIVTRINVETGLFFIQPFWHPVGIIMGVFGVAWLGPEALIVLALLCTVMTIDPRVSLMPMVANALRFSENAGVRPYRLSRWLVFAVLLTLVVGVIGTLYFQYNDGTSRYGWGTNAVPKFPFELLSRNLRKMEGAASTIKMDRELLYPAMIGMGLVLGCSALRLRYTWWPIHPVLFLICGTYAMGRLAASFFAGWVIKVGVTRFGGGRIYRRNKPVFVGMVAGEFVAGIFWVIVGLIYYHFAGPGGPKVTVHP